MTKKIFVYMTILISLSSCASLTTQQPTVNDFRIGEKWTWKWSRTVEGEVKAEGVDLLEIVGYNGGLGFWNGVDTVQVWDALVQKKSATPFRDWPLKVGKKWKFEDKWENNEGTTGTTSQEVEVVSFGEITVAAGKFMAFKIEYRGTVVNSRGFNGKMNDDWWYAPALKTYVKHVNDDNYGLYVNELIDYASAQ